MEQHKLSSIPEEEQLIEREFRDVVEGYLASHHRKRVEIIERAFRFAREAHKGVRRRSGEPYILHPIAVAKIASQEIGLGSTSICAALLHDVVEDTEFTVDDIEQHFGPKIAQLVEGLTKISGGIFGDRASVQAENFRKLLLTMSEDIRVVLIKMADRLHNMRTLGSLAPAKQYKIAGETLYIYAPLAHRLGLFAIKTELEDLSFKYEHPAAYDSIKAQIQASEARRSTVYNDFSLPIIEKLRGLGINFEAKARLKSVYSIWHKMETKHVPFEEVYDLYAMRIIFDCDDPAREKALCWQIYSAITDLYRLHPERTRDWISTPKANGYQALHLTVMGPDGNWIEVQIRSRRMDEIAERGFAAHWKYKEGNPKADDDSELYAWLATIKDILNSPEPDALDFLDTIKLNLFASEIAVFTPKGELLTLPNGSTVLDVAFELHSQIGTACIAGKVNHKLVPLSYRLNSGDQVEVLTSRSQTPKEEWLAYLHSAKARTRLRAALRKEQLPLLTKGREMLDSFLDANGIARDNRAMTKLLGTFHKPNKEELFKALAAGEVELKPYLVKLLRPKEKGKGRSIISKILRPLKKSKESQEADPQAAHQPIDPKAPYILHCDADGNKNFILRDCCSPLPGDDVMGWIDEAGEVELHALSCPRAQALKAGFGNRIVRAEWSEERTGRWRADLRIEGLDRFGILQEIIQMISTHLAIDIRRLDIEAEKEVFHCDLGVLVTDAAAVDSLCTKVKKIKGVTKATRVKLPQTK